MNFAEIVAEIQARNFSDLSDARAGVYANSARAELDRMHLWPWREKSVTGTSPLSISDLGPIEAVINMTNNQPLARVDYQTLLASYGDLSAAGTPQCYYTAWPSGTPAVATFPSSSDTIGVQFWANLPDLTGTDVPASPSDAHYLIVDLAVRRAYRSTDNHEAAEAVQSEIDRQLDALLFNYPPGIQDGPDAYVGVSFASEDW